MDERKVISAWQFILVCLLFTAIGIGIGNTIWGDSSTTYYATVNVTMNTTELKERGLIDGGNITSGNDTEIQTYPYFEDGYDRSIPWDRLNINELQNID